MENTLARKLKQIPEGYLIVGVDPHKKKHAAAAITQDFTVQAKFKFDNTREGLEMMLRQARIGNDEIRLPGCYVRHRNRWPLLAKRGVLPG